MGGDKYPARIAANIVSGIGFLGAGAILRDSGRITGLTTASSIWLAAALGMGIGGGYYLLSSMVAGAILIVFWVFPKFDGWIDKASEIWGSQRRL
jgi:putative Mg2+ transporter-C (MgtC) family protein